MRTLPLLIALCLLGCDDGSSGAPARDAVIPDVAVRIADAAPDATLDAARPVDAAAGPDAAVPDAARPDAVPPDAAVADATAVADAAADAAPDAAPPLPATCPGADFAACGGDIAGAWHLLDFCAVAGPAGAPRPCEGPGEDQAACQGGANLRQCRVEYTGTATFGANGTAIVHFGVAVASEYVFDDACLAVIARGSDPQSRCAAMSNGRIACNYTDGVCRCEAHSDPETDGDHQVPYATDGAGHLTIQGAAGRYCVSGDHLVIDFDGLDHEGWKSWLLTR
jgi:hypothetical protein